MKTKLLLILLLCGLFYSFKNEHQHPLTQKNEYQYEKTTTTDTEFTKPKDWLTRLKTADTNDTCIRKIISTIHYLDTETLSRIYTFERYRVHDSLTGKLAPLNTKSSRNAHYFRTDMSREAESEGVNFAGKYSIVGVGMTGAGMYRCIINRVNGKAYDFPYYGYDDIEFHKNSNLIILHPRGGILPSPDILDDTDEVRSGCDCIWWNCLDYRPLYLLWKNEKLILLTDPKKSEQKSYK